MNSSIIKVAKQDFRKCHATLMNAFSKEKAFTDLMKKMRFPGRITKHMYQMPLKLGFAADGVYATSEDFEGVMVVLPQDKATAGVGFFLSSGAFSDMLALLPLFFRKDLRRLFSIMDKDKKELNIGPYLYLSMLGVDPAAQKAGHGGKLMDFLCEKADNEGKAIYLETQSMENSRWYEKFGFRILKKIEQGKEMELWEMARVKASG